MTDYEPCGNIFVTPELPCTEEMKNINSAPYTVKVSIMKLSLDTNSPIAEISISWKTEEGERKIFVKVPFRVDTISKVIKNYLDLLKHLREEGLLV